MPPQALENGSVGNLPAGEVLSSTSPTDVDVQIQNLAKLRYERAAAEAALIASYYLGVFAKQATGPLFTVPEGSQPNAAGDQAARSAALNTAGAHERQASALEQAAANAEALAARQQQQAADALEMSGFGKNNPKTGGAYGQALATATQAQIDAIDTRAQANALRQSAASLRSIAETPNTVVAKLPRPNLRRIGAGIVAGQAGLGVLGNGVLVGKLNAAIARQELSIIKAQLAAGVPVNDVLVPTIPFTEATELVGRFRDLTSSKQQISIRTDIPLGIPPLLQSGGNQVISTPFTAETLPPANREKIVALIGTLPPQFAAAGRPSPSGVRIPPPPPPTSGFTLQEHFARLLTGGFLEASKVPPGLAKHHTLKMTGVDP